MILSAYEKGEIMGDHEKDEALKAESSPTFDEVVSNKIIDTAAFGLTSSKQGRDERRLALALQLIKEFHPEREGSSRHRGFDETKWKSDFERAIKLADSYLRKVEDRDYDIHAYQLFEEGQQLSAEKTATRFAEAGWEDFKSKNTVAKFFDELETKMAEYADDVAERTPRLRNEKADRAYKKIVSTLQPLLESSTIREAFPDFRDLASDLLGRLVPRYEGLTREEAMEMTFKHVSFLNHCFTTEDRGTKFVRMYRPYEIFRYAELRGWKRERLTITVSVLASDFVPHPPREPKDSFRLFEEEGQDYL